MLDNNSDIYIARSYMCRTRTLTKVVIQSPNVLPCQYACMHSTKTDPHGRNAFPHNSTTTMPTMAYSSAYSDTYSNTQQSQYSPIENKFKKFVTHTTYGTVHGSPEK